MPNSKTTTYFKVDRGLLESDLWLSEPFTKGQAWVDLIGMANYADTETCKRGEILTSISALAKRWGWSRHKVNDFMAGHEKDRSADIKRTPQGIVVTLVNYGVYQGEYGSSGQKKDRSRDKKRTHNNNINNNKRTPTREGVGSATLKWQEIKRKEAEKNDGGGR